MKIQFKEKEKKKVSKTLTLRFQLMRIAFIPILFMSVFYIITALTSSTNGQLRTRGYSIYTTLNSLNGISTEKNADDSLKVGNLTYYNYKQFIQFISPRNSVDPDAQFRFLIFDADCNCISNSLDFPSFKSTPEERSVDMSCFEKQLKKVYTKNIDSFISVRLDKERVKAFVILFKDETGKTQGSLVYYLHNNALQYMKLKILLSQILFSVIGFIFAILVFLVVSYDMTSALRMISYYVKNVAQGRFIPFLDGSVLQKKDELSVMAQNIYEMCKSLQKSLENDPLTGALNRRAGDAYIKNLLTKKKYVVCMGDIDHFKRVNDTYGHMAGDYILQSVANIYNDIMKDKGKIVRWGGEEFLLIFDNPEYTDPDVVLNLMNESLDKLRNSVFSYKKGLEVKDIKVTMTWGVKFHPETSHESAEDLISLADKCLYEGKENGRDQVVSF